MAYSTWLREFGKGLILLKQKIIYAKDYLSFLKTPER